MEGQSGNTCLASMNLTPRSYTKCWVWWTPQISVPGRQTQADPWGSLAKLAESGSSRPVTYPVSENKVDNREMTPKVDFWPPWAWAFVHMGEHTHACLCMHAHTHKHYAWVSTHIHGQASEESWVICAWRRFLRQDPLTQGRDKPIMRTRTIFHPPCFLGPGRWAHRRDEPISASQVSFHQF